MGPETSSLRLVVFLVSLHSITVVADSENIIGYNDPQFS